MASRQLRVQPFSRLEKGRAARGSRPLFLAGPLLVVLSLRTLGFGSWCQALGQRSAHVLFRVIFPPVTQLPQKWLNPGFPRGGIHVVFPYGIACCELLSGHEREGLCCPHETGQLAVLGAGREPLGSVGCRQARPAVKAWGGLHTGLGTWTGCAAAPSLPDPSVCEASPQCRWGTWPSPARTSAASLAPCGFWCHFLHPRVPCTTHAQHRPVLAPAQQSLGVVAGGRGAGRRSVCWEIGPAPGSSFSLRAPVSGQERQMRLISVSRCS